MEKKKKNGCPRPLLRGDDRLTGGSGGGQSSGVLAMERGARKVILGQGPFDGEGRSEGLGIKYQCMGLKPARGTTNREPTSGRNS